MSSSDSFTSSFKEKLTSFSDDQRLDRLKQCMEIQLALNECNRVSQLRKAKKKKKKNAKADVAHTNNNQQQQSWSLSNVWAKKSVTNHTDKEEEDYEPKLRLEETRSGIKISRFYGWGLVNPHAQAAIAEMREQANASTWNSLRPSSSSSSSPSPGIMYGARNTADIRPFTETMESLMNSNNDNTNNNDDTNNSVSCSRETHALWACRAMALGCANDLVKLRKCFNKDNIENEGKYNIPPTSFHYNESAKGKSDLSSSVSSSTSCALEQKVVGDCVLKNWVELNQRIEGRKKETKK